MILSLRFTVSLFAVAAVSAPVIAQQQPPTIQRILLSKVKSDRVPDYEAAVKEYMGVLKKASSRHPISAWVSLTGDHEYARVDNFMKWAEMDSSPHPYDSGISEQDRASLQGIGPRITSYVETARTVIVTIPPDLNTTAGQPLPPMVEVTWLRLQLGKGAEYRTLAKNELLPSEKQMGRKFLYIGNVAFGDYAGQEMIVGGLSKWAEFDGESTPESYQKYLAKANAMAISRKRDVYRFLPELSYLPAPQQSSRK